MLLCADFNVFDTPVSEILINNLQKHGLDQTTVMQNCTNRVAIDCSLSKWESGKRIDWSSAGAGAGIVHYFKNHLSS